MAVWKLNPINLSHPDWEASRYHEEVIIRAESEDRARRIATRAFRKAAEKPPGEKINLSPWDQTALVSTVEIKDASFPETGKEEILAPEKAREYQR